MEEGEPDRLLALGEKLKFTCSPAKATDNGLRKSPVPAGYSGGGQPARVLPWTFP